MPETEFDFGNFNFYPGSFSWIKLAEMQGVEGQ